MYLLDTASDELLMYFGIFIGFLIFLWILYAIIKNAVVSALSEQNRDIINQLRLNNNLKALDMEKGGWTKVQLKDIREKTLQYGNHIP